MKIENISHLLHASPLLPLPESSVMLIFLHGFSKLSCHKSHLPLTTYPNTFVLHFIYLFVLVDTHVLCTKAHVHMIRDQLSGIDSLFSSHGFGSLTHIVRE